MPEFYSVVEHCNYWLKIILNFYFLVPPNHVIIFGARNLYVFLLLNFLKIQHRLITCLTKSKTNYYGCFLNGNLDNLGFSGIWKRKCSQD